VAVIRTSAVSELGGGAMPLVSSPNRMVALPSASRSTAKCRSAGVLAASVSTSRHRASPPGSVTRTSIEPATTIGRLRV
jgi:hypothetical protein